MAVTLVLTDAPSATVTLVNNLRELVCKRTGRFDLVGVKTEDGRVVPDYTVDAGVDSYINEAQLRLCAEWPMLRQGHKFTFTCAVGDTTEFLTGCERIETVHVTTTTDRIAVKQIPYREFCDYWEYPENAVLTGQPEEWCFDTLTEATGDAFGLQLRFAPVADAAYTFTLVGDWFPPAFPDAVETNWLVRTQPFLLADYTAGCVEEALANNQLAQSFFGKAQRQLDTLAESHYNRLADAYRDGVGRLVRGDFEL